VLEWHRRSFKKKKNTDGSVNKITVTHYTMLKDAGPSASPCPQRVNLQSLILLFEETFLPHTLSV